MTKVQADRIARSMAESLADHLDAQQEYLRKRLLKIAYAKRGAIKMKRIKVEEYEVPRYTVGTHYRWVTVKE